MSVGATVRIWALFVTLVGLYFAAHADSIMVGDVEIDPEGFSAKHDPKRRIDQCLACHGDHAGGDIDFGPDTHFGTPAIRGMREAYLKESLIAYKNGTRIHEEMSAISAMLDDETIDFMASSVGAFEAPPLMTEAELEALAETDALFREGREIAQQGIPQKGVPACMTCHGSLGVGTDVGPRLAGQNVMYIENQFKAFANGARRTAKSAVMQPVVGGMTPDDIKAAAHYYEAVSATRR